MYCTNCGFKLEDEAEFCSQCGMPVNKKAEPVVEYTPEPAYENVARPCGTGFSHLITELVSSGEFLAMTILVTAKTAFSLIAGSGIPLLDLLLTIFMWMSYSSAKKGMVNYNNLRKISGTVFAQKVIAIVSAAIIGFCGAAFLAAQNFVGDVLTSGEFTSQFESELQKNGVELGELFDELGPEFSNFNMSGFLPIFSSALGIALIVVAVLILLYAIFAIGSIHKLIKSVYEGVRDDNPIIKKLGAGRGWILAIGIIEALGSLSTIGFSNNKEMFAMLANGSGVAVCIVAFVLLGKLKTFEK